MMNYVWAALLIIPAVWAVASGNPDTVSGALLSGGANAIEMMLTVGGAMCLWGGLMEIANRAGITRFLSRCFSPVIHLIMPDVPKGSPAEGAITMNIAANLMGLGNAATPLGLSAMRRLSALAPDKTVATRSMSAFVVLNTASIQLIPSTLALLRQKAGSVQPLDVLPCIWIVSVLSLGAGLAVFFVMSKKGKE